MLDELYYIFEDFINEIPPDYIGPKLDAWLDYQFNTRIWPDSAVSDFVLKNAECIHKILNPSFKEFIPQSLKDVQMIIKINKRISKQTSSH